MLTKTKTNVRTVFVKTTAVRTPWLRTTQAKRLFSLCRWLHIYISSALFGLLMFFCFTGITLNHPDWASSLPAQDKSFTLPEALTDNTNGEYPVKKIQAFIEAKTGLSSPRSIDLALDIGEITYDYPLPSGYAFITVILEEQLVEVEHQQGNWLALINDLHKGRHSGKTWSWLIDLSALLMLVFSLTGIIILLQNAKNRRSGYWLVIAGCITPAAIYFSAVPRLLI